jgi:hypothetical protein
MTRAAGSIVLGYHDCKVRKGSGSFWPVAAHLRRLIGYQRACRGRSSARGDYSTAYSFVLGIAHRRCQLSSSMRLSLSHPSPPLGHPILLRLPTGQGCEGAGCGGQALFLPSARRGTASTQADRAERGLGPFATLGRPIFLRLPTCPRGEGAGNDAQPVCRSTDDLTARRVAAPRWPFATLAARSTLAIPYLAKGSEGTRERCSTRVLVN